MIPAWYLVAVNLETGEEKVLLESPTERVMDIIESFPSAYARIPQDGASDKEYWLYHGAAIPKINDKPPWPKQNSPWAKAVPKPEVYFDQIDPDENGNPSYLGDFDRTTRVGLMHSSVLGADGKIYFGGFGLRHYTGGGFGWFDPKTGKLDGIWQPFSGYAVQWITPVSNGRFIVISTIRAPDELNNNKSPEEAKLFVFDAGT